MSDTQTAEAPSREAALDAMHDVIDPELGYNIVDIGLIYGLEVVDHCIQVTMTMTTPGCPAQDYIMAGVKDRGQRIPGVEDVDITLVWDPLWSTEKMTPIAKEHFGIADSSGE